MVSIVLLSDTHGGGLASESWPSQGFAGTVSQVIGGLVSKKLS